MTPFIAGYFVGSIVTLLCLAFLRGAFGEDQ